MAKFKPGKPDSKIKVKKLQETEGLNTGFGEYKESTGGGKPFEAGNSNTRTTRENGKERQAKNPSTNQPRDNSGHFTYKSVNGQSIDPKYGPSRGKTVPPTLTGGDGTIKIEDVEKGFAKQSGAYWDKYKDKWYQKGSMVVTTGLSTKVSKETVWNQAKEYDKNLGEFKGESENWETKKGGKSKEEKEAIDKVKQSGEQQNVIEKETGAIKVKGGKKAIQDFIESKKEPEKVEPVKEEVKEEVKVQEEPDKPWGKTGKFTEKQANKAKEAIKAELGPNEFDESFWTDEVLEEFMQLNESKLSA